MRNLFLALFLIIPTMASAIQFEGVRGHITNYSDIPTKDLRIEVMVCWQGIIGDGCQKVKVATYSVDKSGDFEISSRSFTCLFCIGLPSLSTSIVDKNDKIRQPLSSYEKNDQNVTLIKLNREVTHVQTLDGRTVEEWMKSEDSPVNITYNLEYFLDGEDKPFVKKSAAWDSAYTSSLVWFETYALINRAIPKGKSMKAVLTAQVGSTLIKKIESSALYPDFKLPTDQASIVLDSTKLNFDISGKYSMGQIANVLKTAGAEFVCQNGILSGRILFVDQEAITVAGECSFGKASFPIDITIQNNGWSKRVVGVAELKVFGPKAAGTIIVEGNDYDQAISFSK